MTTASLARHPQSSVLATSVQLRQERETQSRICYLLGVRCVCQLLLGNMDATCRPG